ncbi:hypothetical protein CRUP_028093, partial [Coryphaenoides rupestris]
NAGEGPTERVQKGAPAARLSGVPLWTAEQRLVTQKPHSAREGRHLRGDRRPPLLQQEQDRGAVPDRQVFLLPGAKVVVSNASLHGRGGVQGAAGPEGLELQHREQSHPIVLCFQEPLCLDHNVFFSSSSSLNTSFLD